MKNRLKIIKIIFSIALLSALILKVGISDIAITLGRLKLLYLIPVLFFSFASFFLSAINHYILFRSLGISASYKGLFRCNLMGWALSLLIPGKIGALSTAYFLKKEGIELGKASAVIVLDKIISFIVVSMFGIAGLFMFLSVSQSLQVAAAALAMLLAAMFIILAKTPRILVRKYILRKYENNFRGFSAVFFFFIKKGKYALSLNFLNTCLNLAATSMPVYFLLKGLGQDMPLLTVILLSSIVQIASSIPITPNGTGLRELSAVFLFSLKGAGSAEVMGAYLIMLLIKYAIGFFVMNFLLKEDHLKVKEALG